KGAGRLPQAPQAGPVPDRPAPARGRDDGRGEPVARGGLPGCWVMAPRRASLGAETVPTVPDPLRRPRPAGAARDLSGQGRWLAAWTPAPDPACPDAPSPANRPRAR